MKEQQGVIRVGQKTVLTVAVVVAVVGGYLGWHFFKPEPSPRTVVMKYLKLKTKPAPWKKTVDASLREAQTPWLDLPKILQADEDYPSMYRHLAPYVIFADQLLIAKDQDQRVKGLQLAIGCVQATIGGPEDTWLAARMCEAFLLPNLKLGGVKPGVVPTRDQLIAQTIQTIQSSEDLDGQIAVYRKIAARESTAHEADWARSQAAALLGKFGKDKEASVLLAEIKNPRGNNWFSRFLSNLKKPAAKKQAARTNAAPRK